jgi:hypothetical protein
MKKLFENWRRHLNESKEQPLGIYPTKPDGKATPSHKMKDRMRQKSGKHPLRKEGAEEEFIHEIEYIAGRMLEPDGLRHRSQVEGELVSFNVDRGAKERDRGYSNEELVHIWTEASKMMMGM